MKEIKKWEDLSEILERYISENYISKRELEEEEIEHQQEIREAIKEERERIIEEIEKTRIETEPQAEGTDVDDTMRTINNTISSIVMRIKRLNNPTSQ